MDNVLALFQTKCEVAMQRIPEVQQFRDSDPMVELVFKIGRELFDTPLDQQNTDKLIRNGGRLSGAYVYLGQKSAYARAKRDVYAQKMSEVEKERLVQMLRAGVKVTEARASVSGEVADLADFVNEQEIQKNQWENIVDAVERMTSFIQSAIRVKEGEKFHGRLQENG